MSIEPVWIPLVPRVIYSSNPEEDVWNYIVRLVERLSKEAERLQWRRNKVLELSSQGLSQPRIATTLRVGLGGRDQPLQYLRQEAKENIMKYIDEKLPEEYRENTMRP